MRGGGGELCKVAPMLKALAALPENPGSSPRLCKSNHSHLEFQFQGIQDSLLTSAGISHIYGAWKYKQTKLPCTQK